MEIADVEQKKFRSRVVGGLDPRQVEEFVQELADELRRLKAENETLKRELQARELEIREHQEREKTIRTVLFSAHKSAEQIKTNAEREAKIILSEAEVKAEKILRDAGERLLKMEREISELKRNRIMFGARVRALLDAFRQMLDEEGKDKFTAAREEEAARAEAPEFGQQPGTEGTAGSEEY